MKKYLGIVKITTRAATGVELKVLTKFSSSKSYIEKWLRLYPDSENLVLMNNEDIQGFFEDFLDVTPVTEKEKKEAIKAYEKFKKNSPQGETREEIEEMLKDLYIKYRDFCNECPKAHDFTCSGADSLRCQKEKDKIAAEIKRLGSKLK